MKTAYLAAPVPDEFPSLASGGQAILSRPRAGILYHDSQGNPQSFFLSPEAPPAREPGDRWRISAGQGPVHLTWTLEADHTLTLSAENRGDATLRVDELHVLEVGPDTGGYLNIGPLATARLYCHGWQSWSPTEVRLLSHAAAAHPPEEYEWKHVPHPETDPTVRDSEWLALVGQAEAVLAAGFVTASDQLGAIRTRVLDTGIYLAAICFADGIPLAPGATLRSEKLLVAWGDPLELLEEMAARLGQAGHARIPARASTGWCSWYMYYGTNTDADVRANLEAARREQLPLEWFLLDDGYQNAIGDWTDIRRDRYPDGMKALADEIRLAGRVPGIWVAPFGASRESRLATEHPEYLLRDETGLPVLAWRHSCEDIFALDLTRPEVIDHLARLFRTLSDEWGFQVFKLDFVFAGARPGVRYDPRVTRAQAYRRGLQVIRDAVGDKILLGCGAPMAPSVGLVDAMRVGPDVSFTWGPFEADLSQPSTANAIRNTLLRWAFHRRLWLNDGDCVMVRTKKQGTLLTNAEITTLATVVGLSGGLTIDSDDLNRLSSRQIGILRRIMPPIEPAARPLDLLASDLPSRLRVDLKPTWDSEPYALLAAINWEAQPCAVELALPEGGPYHLYDVWAGRYRGVARGRMHIPALGKHAAALMVCKPVSNRGDVLGTTFHFAGGVAEIRNLERDRNGLTVELEKPGHARGDILFTLPPGRTAARAQVQGHRRQVRPIAAGVVAVHATLDERARVELEFEPV